MIHVTRNNWQSEVLDAKVPVVVDFFATWCGPCKMLTPILESLAAEYDRFKIVKCDVDEAPDLADLNKIRVVPTLVCFKEGAAVKKHEGLLSKDAFLAEFGL